MPDPTISKKQNLVHDESRPAFTQVPAVVKKVFDFFPLVQYPPAPRPSSCIFPDNEGKIGTVFVHDISSDSIYPSTLSLLTILKLAGLASSFLIIPVSAHASVQASSITQVSVPYIRFDTPDLVIKSRTLSPQSSVTFGKWLASAAPDFPQQQQKQKQQHAASGAVLLSLIEVNIGDAFLASFYADRTTFDSAVLPALASAYTGGDDTTGSLIPFAQGFLARRDVINQIHRSTGTTSSASSSWWPGSKASVPSVEVLYKAADALDALDVLLQQHDFLSGIDDRPGIADATLFAYVWPVIRHGAPDTELRRIIENRPRILNLVRSVYERAWK
ncbi:hypothetical protein V1514DRAFT_133022 [Lipomyces japonicus]|uniref:uncharacterized protein n=1 Tax=Lipomyces japonicus TaxID=56871 RepID=UPI0034CFE070